MHALNWTTRHFYHSWVETQAHAHSSSHIELYVAHLASLSPILLKSTIKNDEIHVIKRAEGAQWGKYLFLKLSEKKV